MAVEVVTESGVFRGDAKTLVATPEELDAVAARVERLYRIVRWGFPGSLAGIVALMICFCDSCLKTRLDKIVEYSALIGLLGFFSVSIFVVMRALMKRR